MTADPDFLSEMIGFTAQQLMELEAELWPGPPKAPAIPKA